MQTVNVNVPIHDLARYLTAGHNLWGGGAGVSMDGAQYVVRHANDDGSDYRFSTIDAYEAVWHYLARINGQAHITVSAP